MKTRIIIGALLVAVAVIFADITCPRWPDNFIADVAVWYVNHFGPS